MASENSRRAARTLAPFIRGHSGSERSFRVRGSRRVSRPPGTEFLLELPLCLQAHPLRLGRGWAG